ncbi:hypothetical protein EJB05_33133, partial [Eragrostis curvula]
VLEVYERLLALGIKVVFITGRHDYQREPTIKNLRSAGYHTWEKLELKNTIIWFGSKLSHQASIIQAHMIHRPKSPIEAEAASNLKLAPSLSKKKPKIGPFVVHGNGPSSRLGSSVVPYKSGERQKLVDAGYRIVGNMGDQWSDLVGAPEGDRTFKVPDPMYYVA